MRDRYKVSPKRFCNRSCASKFYIKDGTFDEWRLRKNESIGVWRDCDGCGKPNACYVTPGKRPGKKRFCERACKNVWFARTFVGENHQCFGTKRSDEAKLKQQETLQRNHPGTTNAFELAQKRTKTKPQIKIHEALKENDHSWQIEKLVQGTKYYADVVSFDRKVIVEFNGDYWHCNPRSKYGREDFFHPIKQKFARQIWEDDKRRLNELRKLGFSVFVVWEDEFRNGRWKEILMDFLKREAA